MALEMKAATTHDEQLERFQQRGLSISHASKAKETLSCLVRYSREAFLASPTKKPCTPCWDTGLKQGVNGHLRIPIFGHEKPPRYPYQHPELTLVTLYRAC